MEAILVLPLPRREAAVSDGVDDLYRAEASALLGMMTAFLGDRAAAEDVVSEAFLRVQRSWAGITPGREAAYLRTAAFNLARSTLRHHAVVRRFRPERSGPVAGPDDGVVLAEDQRAVIDAVRRLPLRQRECVVLRYYSDLPEAAIAATLGISVNSVKTHLRRGRSALAEALEGRR